MKENARFTKNDDSFICTNCKKHVKSLGYTSRDHCPNCLVSLHVDINPGDRANECKGMMFPIDIINKKKGTVIVYKCSKCGEIHNNIVSNDDNFETILRVMNKTYK